MNYEKAIEELASYIFDYYKERFLSGDEPDEVIFDVYGLEDADLLKDLQDLGINFPVDLESVRYNVEERLWEKYNKKYKKGEM